jgi:hypothetical protein
MVQGTGFPAKGNWLPWPGVSRLLAVAARLMQAMALYEKRASAQEVCLLQAMVSA